MSNTYGQDPIDHSKEEIPGEITNSDGDDIVEITKDVAKREDDDEWMFKLKSVSILPEEANREAFKTFNRTFTTLGGTPTEEQRVILIPILSKLYASGFSLRCKDITFAEEFYTWTASSYKRAEYYMAFKKRGIKFKPTKEGVDNAAISIALDAKISRFPNFNLEKFKEWKDIGKLMLGLNSHVMLGSDLETPITFMILNTPGGEESGDRVDFDTIGFNLDVLLLAQRYNIPTFNINKAGAFERLEEFIDASI